jgi:class 3 adenylate cyclase/TolB-like protein
MGPQEHNVERRIAAILAADMVAYSRLMGQDEEGTLARLKALRRELVDPLTHEHRGHIVKTTGDGFLVEFASAVEAVRCAIELQRDMLDRNANLSEAQHILFRIGINLGDVIHDEHDLFGDAVNVAARLERLSDPGGVCISRTVWDHIQDRLPFAFQDAGEHQVKNIARPVQVFALAAESIAAIPEFPHPQHRSKPVRSAAWLGIGLALVLALATAAVWWMLASDSSPIRQADADRPTTNLATLSKATLAVLPLISSGDNSDTYFADGLTEDLITALGRFRELLVISRAATMVYKGKTPTLDEVRRDLRVRYVVEGSVRRSPERIRVTISLSDTSRGAILWSERYDTEQKDIFSVQDRITQQITGALAIQVTAQELAQAGAKSVSNLEAYDLVLRGRNLLSRVTRSSNAQARTLFENAIGLAPDYAPAYVGLGQVNLRSILFGWTPHPNDALAHAESLARKAIDLDNLNPGAHALLGNVALYLGEYDRALRELRRAIDLNPSDAEAYSALMAGLLWSGDIQGAIAAGQTLMRFQPSLTAIESFHLATAYTLADQAADAIALLSTAIDRNRANLYTHVALAIAYAQAGMQREAEQQAALIRERYPTFSRERFGSLLRDPVHRERLEAGLTKAGL